MQHQQPTTTGAGQSSNKALKLAGRQRRLHHVGRVFIANQHEESVWEQQQRSDNEKMRSTTTTLSMGDGSIQDGSKACSSSTNRETHKQNSQEISGKAGRVPG